MTAHAKNHHPRLGRPRDDALAARRRDQILRAAVRHFARCGYADADLDAVAADVGCAKGTLYRYFPSKAALFQRSVDLVMRELLEAVLAAGTSEDAVERLEQRIRGFLAHFDAHPQYIELLIQERAAFRDRKKPTYLEHREANAGRWKPDFRQMMDAGRMRRMPVERVLDVIGDLLYGTIFTNHFAGRTKSLEQQARDVLDVLFFGLLTPKEAPRPAKD